MPGSLKISNGISRRIRPAAFPARLRGFALYFQQQAAFGGEGGGVGAVCRCRAGRLVAVVGEAEQVAGGVGKFDRPAGADAEGFATKGDALAQGSIGFGDVVHGNPDGG